MLSSTPPYEDSLKSSQESNATAWKKNDGQPNHRVGKSKLLLPEDRLIVTDKPHSGSPSSTKTYTSSCSGSAVTKTTSALQPCPASPADQKGHEGQCERRMNTNGFDRSRLSGNTPTTNETSTWLADASSSSHAHQRPTEGMLASRLISGQEGHLVLSSGSQANPAPASASSLFRPPLTLPEVPTQRLYPNVGQYPSLYTTSASNPLYSSPMYTLHGQPTHLASVSPYSSLYPQFASSYGHGSLLASHYPHIESYSAVLASMGSHVQQTQLPRSPYLTGHIPQFSALASSSSHAHMTSANSPGPSLPHLSNQSVAGQLHPDLGNKSKTDYEMRGRLTSAPLPLRDTKLHDPSSSHSPGSQGKASKGRDNMKQDGIPKDLAYKGVPCGKEGSLKHRILTRPPDIQIDRPPLSDVKATLSPRVKTELPSPKRTKASASISHLPTVAEVAPSGGSVMAHGTAGRSHSHPVGYTPPYMGSQPHYPPHFMKGSIIELANGDFKRVEDLETDDFVNSAQISSDLKIDSSTVVRIQENYERGTAILSFSVGEHRVQVTVEATMEHPFFVFGRGWSSCSPDRTLQRYGLGCKKLAVGDVCISLTHKDVTTHASQLNREPSEQRRKGRNGAGSVRFTTPSRMPPPARVMSLEEGQRLHSLKEKQTTQDSKVVGEEASSKVSLSQSSHPENMPPRKRRWSAPDQVSVETDAEPPSKKSLKGENSKSPGAEPAGGNT
ncbi:ataxin-1-like isoform X2 [Liolophura sinensis]